MERRARSRAGDQTRISTPSGSSSSPAPRAQVARLLGRWGWASSSGEDLVLDEVVAIKSSGHVADDDGAIVARFKREISLNRKVKHPNVARMYDFGTSGGHPFITMEFVPGKDLQTLILEAGRIAPARALPILGRSAWERRRPTKQGIVHRDLKSQNIIVGEGDTVSILDFGLGARPRRREAHARRRRPRDATTSLPSRRWESRPTPGATSTRSGSSPSRCSRESSPSRPTRRSASP
ncbi:MAG: protein kinase [Holophagales bacterium]|nr:protein kinase [Holophagales bacterium]